ncbi:MAG: hypothetical protein HND47_06965 [Chloroflexi bacterium]|nr:hypothetical protein [Chloroflexota bacterium]
MPWRPNSNRLSRAERDHAIHDEQTKLDKKLRQKLDRALHELNSIAVTELRDQREGEDHRKVELPESGMGFFPERLYVQTGQAATLILRVALGENERQNATASVISNSPEIIVATPQVTFKPHKTDPTVLEARVKVEGRQVGGEGTVTAYLGRNRAQAIVQVHSKKETLVAPPTRGSNALFTDIKFDDRTDPRQRVYYDRVNSSIVIATAAPSVRIYLDGSNRLDTTVQGQVLLAELITEAVCREIAREGVEKGKYFVLEGSEADAIQNHFIRLQNRYAHLIHQYIVTKE